MRFLFLLSSYYFILFYFALLNVVFINSWKRPLSVLHQSQEDLLVVMSVCHSASKVNSLSIEAEAEKTGQGLIPNGSRSLKAF